MKGRITQIIGPVVDVIFDDYTPKIYTALKVGDLTLEVEQILGGGKVRTVAMGQTEGLRRNMEVVSLDVPISVPVGDVTLGRIFNVLGEVIDEGKKLPEKVKLSPIHKQAPEFTDLSSNVEVLETSTEVTEESKPAKKKKTKKE